MQLSLIARAAVSAAFAGLLPTMAVSAAENATKQPLTVALAIETVRILTNDSAGALNANGAPGPANPDGAVSVSPDGRRYVVRLVRGEVARNGVWMEILTGGLDSLKSAQAHRSVARLFTSGLGAGIGAFGSDMDVTDFSVLRWLDNERVVFLWSDERSMRQLVQVNLTSGKVDWLTAHPTPVNAFDLSSTGAVLYTARARIQTDSADLFKNGFAVPGNIDAYSIFHRNLASTGFDIAFNTEWFMQDGPQSAPRELQVAGRKVDLNSYHVIAFAPDGRTALISSAPENYPAEWDRYTGFVQVGIAPARRDPRDSSARTLAQLYVVDTASGKTRPLWNALYTYRDAKWSPDGRSLLLVNTYLPVPGADQNGLAGRATAIVEVATGKYQQLPIELRGRELTSVRWIDASQVQIQSRKGDDVQQAHFRKQGSKWRARAMGEAPRTEPVPVRIEVREDLNTPPRLFAVELQAGKPSGREAMILDPNPGLLDRVALGRAEIIEGKLGEERWKGLLFHPVDYKPGQRYPLLIQSVYGTNIRSEFTLYGLGDLGPTPIATYPGQVLANRGVAVLLIDVSMGAKMGGPQEADIRKNAFVAAAEQLVASGLVDRERIGLAGFSRNGWYAEYTLTHSDFPFAAAIAADNWDPSYMSTAWFGSQANAGAVIGAEPFGEGLKLWLEKAPAFNADKVRVPLMKVEQSTGGLFGVMAHWEIFSRLRYLKKPVEFYVMPQAAEHGAHNTQNPGQIMAVQQRAVDWFDFWLNGREDADPRKAQQYAGWRQLKALHEANRSPTSASRPGF